MSLIQCEPFCRIFSGKPDLRKDHISNSGLSEIKRILMSGRPFLGDEKYLIFGSELHIRFLEGKPSKLLTDQEEYDLASMVLNLNRNLFVQRLMKDSQREITEIGLIDDIRFKWIGDITNQVSKRKRIGADLKTTSAKTEKEFISLALNKYDYLRQGWCYRTAGKLDEFYFIGIQKHEPYNVYILNVKDYAKEENRIVKETKFLLSIYKQYGRVITKQTGWSGTKSSSDSEREIRGTRT